MSRTENGREEGRSEERIDFVNLAEHLSGQLDSRPLLKERIKNRLPGRWRCAGRRHRGADSFRGDDGLAAGTSDDPMGLAFFSPLGIRAWLKRGSPEKPISSINRKRIVSLFIVIIPFIPHLSWVKRSALRLDQA